MRLMTAVLLLAQVAAALPIRAFALTHVRATPPRLCGSDYIASQLEHFLQSDAGIQKALAEVNWDADDEEDEDSAQTEAHTGSKLAPAHARPIAELDEAVYVRRAWAEESYLSAAEKVLEPIEKDSAAQVASKLRSAGVARVPSVLSADVVAELRQHILDALCRADRDARGSETGGALDEVFRLVVVGSGTQRLSDERGRSSDRDALRAALENAAGGRRGKGRRPAAETSAGGDRISAGGDPSEGSNLRWDLRLSAESPAVRCALREIFAAGAPLGGALEIVGGEAAELWEIAAIVSAPGAAPQVVHADTVWQKAPLLYTAFIALQDVSRDMGPTRFLPRTHNHPSHHAIIKSDGGATMLGKVAKEGGERQPPLSRVGCLETGAAALYDGRLLHCGGANRSNKLRMLFYLTLRCEDAAELQSNSVRLADLQREWRGERGA